MRVTTLITPITLTVTPITLGNAAHNSRNPQVEHSGFKSEGAAEAIFRHFEGFYTTYQQRCLPNRCLPYSGDIPTQV